MLNTYNLLNFLPRACIVLNGTQNEKGHLNRSRLLCKLLCHLGCMIQLVQRCLKYLWQIGLLLVKPVAGLN